MTFNLYNITTHPSTSQSVLGDLQSVAMHKSMPLSDVQTKSKIIQQNLSKSNPFGTGEFVQFRKVLGLHRFNLHRHLIYVTVMSVCLGRISVYSGFGLDRFHRIMPYLWIMAFFIVTLIALLCLRVGILLTCCKHLNDRIVSLGGGGLDP